MAKVELLELLAGKWEDGTRPKDIFSSHVSRDPRGHVSAIIAGLGGRAARVRNGCAELASLLSEAHPQLLYPHLALFQANLEAKEPVLRWEAVCTIGNLAAVDADGRTRASFEPIARCLDEPSIVLQGHAVRALAKMARAFPDLGPRILRRLTAAADRFPGSRIGYVVEAMATFAGDRRLAPEAARFVAPYAESDIASVTAKARRALRQLRRDCR